MCSVYIDIEVQVPCVAWQTVGDALRPFDSEAPRWSEEIVDHQGVKVRPRTEAVGIQMHELATAFIERV